jgi:hypothetical protein
MSNQHTTSATATTKVNINDISERTRIHSVKLEADQKCVKLTNSVCGINSNACAIEAIRLLNQVRLLNLELQTFKARRS